jgi:murein DD-endopeptidase MepM/ murein hydrolase activator NlpD
MPIGTYITAARAGTVVHVEESGTDGHFPNNLVVIRHPDYTFAQYMHLTQNGALVNIGDEVKQGAIIGRSGSTGLAGYPHLHFIITRDDWQYPYTGIPFNFKNTRPNPRSLEMGTDYPAYSY